MTTVRFNTKSKRFINEKGQFISEQFVLDSLNGHRSQVQARVKAHTEKYLNSSMSEPQTQIFLKAVASEVRYITSVEYVIGRGGINNITPENIETLNQILTEELTTSWGNDGHSYGLEEVVTRFENSEISEAQLANSVQNYVKGSRKAYWEAQAELNNEPYMQRFLHGTDNCQSCIGYANAGVVKSGELPLPGQKCECYSNCNCTVKYLNQKQYRSWIKKKFSQENIETDETIVK